MPMCQPLQAIDGPSLPGHTFFEDHQTQTTLTVAAHNFDFVDKPLWPCQRGMDSTSRKSALLPL